MPPVISNVTGSLADKSTAVIAGSGFGTRSRPGPLVFETFAGGRKNSAALMNNATGGEMVYLTSGTMRPRRTGVARADFTKKSGSEGQWSYFRFWEDAAHYWFLSYWVYLPSTWHWGTDAYPGSDDALANIKFLRWFPRGPNYTNIDAVLHGFDNYNIKRAYESATGNDEQYINLPHGDLRDYFVIGKWVNVRTEYGENSGLDKRDGTFRIWIDGIKIFDDRAVMTNKSGDPDGAKDKAPYVIGFYDSWSPVSGPSTMYAYFADVIVDDTWARVELGDAPTYDACTRVEVQPATAWSASSITVTVNAGATADNGHGWLYVTDSTGARNTTGVPVTIGQGGGEIVPPPDGGGGEDSMISIVQGPAVGKVANTSPQVVSFVANAAAGRSVVVIVNAYAGGGTFSSVTVTDDGTNSYTKVVERALTVSGGQSYLAAFRAGVTTPADVVNVTLSGTGTRGCTAVAYELDGVDGTTPVIDSDAATGSSAAPAVPALTISGDTFTFGAVQTYGSGAAITPSTASGFTNSLTAEAPAGTGSDYSIITRATTTETSVAPGWTRQKSCQWQAIGFALKAGAAPIPPDPPTDPIIPAEQTFDLDIAEGVRKIRVKVTFEDVS